MAVRSRVGKKPTTENQLTETHNSSSSSPEQRSSPRVVPSQQYGNTSSREAFILSVGLVLGLLVSTLFQNLLIHSTHTYSEETPTSSYHTQDDSSESLLRASSSANRRTSVETDTNAKAGREGEPTTGSAADFDKAAEPEFGSHNDYIIVGAGPGGMQLGLFLQQDGQDYRIIEKAEVAGNFFVNFPRHGRLISLNKRHTSKSDADFNLRHDWNSLLGGTDDTSPLMRDYSEDLFPTNEAYVQYLNDFYLHHNLKVEFGREITAVRRKVFPDKHQGFEIRSSDGSVTTCRYLVWASAFQKQFVPDIPGIELAEGYDNLPADPKNFTNQRVLVLGLGNAAFETAQAIQGETAYVHVLGRSKGGLRFAFRTHYVGDLRAVNDGALDTFLLKSLDTVDVEFDLLASNTSLVRQPDGTIRLVSDALQHNLNYREPYDRVIRCLGWRFDDSVFEPALRPQMAAEYSLGKGKFPAQRNDYQSVNVANLYFAGTLMHVHDFKRSAGGFVHGFRYLARALHRIMNLNHHRRTWPHATLEGRPEVITEHIYDRIRSSSGLYQMFGVLCDVVLVLDPPSVARPRAVYMQEVPIAFLKSSLAEVDTYMVVAWHFDYGHDAEGGYANNAQATLEAGRAHHSQFLHPVVQALRPAAPGRGLQQVAEFHVLEDLLATWDHPEVHRSLLGAFLQRVFEGDYTSQEEQLQQYGQELQANLTREERRTTTTKHSPHFGTFVFQPSP